MQKEEELNEINLLWWGTNIWLEVDAHSSAADAFGAGALRQCDEAVEGINKLLGRD
jgi:hypothetical protein